MPPLGRGRARSGLAATAPALTEGRQSAYTLAESVPLLGRVRLLFGIALHAGLLFVLPVVVGGITSFFADVLEVKETLTALLGLSAAVFTPLVLLQLVGIVAKLRRALRHAPALGQDRLELVHRHVRVLAPRGTSLLAVSLLAVMMALAVKWAQFGILAVMGLSLVYLEAGVGTIVSAFLVRDLDDRVRRRGGALGRELSPAVVDAGAEVEERIVLRDVPIPPGFRLCVHEVLPDRFGCETRFVLERPAAGRALTVSARLRRTPRGVHHFGPARVWLEDVLGLVRVEVAHAMTAELRVLPRSRTLLVEDPPRARTHGEGPFTLLRRQPSEDYFRFRDYLPGDDPRRIHWKLSVKVGRMQVRMPETVPVVRKRIRLVLDTHAPAALLAQPRGPEVLADLLDAAVEAWVSMAKLLVGRGEDVTLALALPGPEGPKLLEIPARRGTERAWRSEAARVEWQSSLDLGGVLAAGAAGLGAVVVTAGLVVPETLAAPVTWVVVPAATHVPAPPVAPASSILLQRFPPGADENGWLAGHARRRRARALARAHSAAASAVSAAHERTVAHVRASGDPHFRVEPRGPVLVLAPA